VSRTPNRKTAAGGRFSNNPERTLLSLESFWSIFERGIVGSFHKVSAKYMPLYVVEFQFRYNNRENADIGAAISGC
jgi:ISXO2 transposase-like protein